MSVERVTIDRLSPALILLARALRSKKHADAIAAGLDLTRRARGGEKADTLDAHSLRILRGLRPIIAEHGGNTQAFVDAVHAAGIGKSQVTAALQVEDAWAKRAEGTRELLAIVNEGRSKGWTLPDKKPRKPGFSQWRHAMEAVA